MSDIADKLDEARALIEKGWTQGASWRDRNGALCQSKDAACFCSFGAISWQSYGDVGAAAFDMLERTVGRNPIAWNDAPGRTQAEVIEAFRKAADLARSEAAAVGGR